MFFMQTGFQAGNEAPNGLKTHIFLYLCGPVSIHLTPSGAKYRKKGWGFENWRGVIGKPILGLLTFG